MRCRNLICHASRYYKWSDRKAARTLDELKGRDENGGMFDGIELGDARLQDVSPYSMTFPSTHVEYALRSILLRRPAVFPFVFVL